AAGQIGVEKIFRITLGAQPGSDLVRRQTAGHDPLPELLEESRIVLKHLLRLFRSGALRLHRCRQRQQREAGKNEKRAELRNSHRFMDGLTHGWKWSRRDSNPGPLLCESSALTS